MRYVPLETDLIIEDIMLKENAIERVDAWKKANEYMQVGREIKKMAKVFGIK
jgi:hypothetical protein